MRKRYRACACKKAGYCPRYKRDMPKEYWEMCQTSEKHRMLFDELAGNFYFGMVQRRNPHLELPEFTPIKKLSEEARKKLIEAEKIRPKSKEGETLKKMRQEQIAQANNAINALKQEGLDLKQLDKVEERGLGDTVERVLTKFGLTKELMTKIAGKSCGCSERKKWLNKLLPYGKETTEGG